MRIIVVCFLTVGNTSLKRMLGAHESIDRCSAKSFPSNLGCQERSRNLHQHHAGQGKSERRLEVGKIMAAGWQGISTLWKDFLGKLSKDCPWLGLNMFKYQQDGRTLKSTKKWCIWSLVSATLVGFAIYEHITDHISVFGDLGWTSATLGTSIADGLALLFSSNGRCSYPIMLKAIYFTW